MQSVALGKGEILLEAWQTHFIRDLVTSSKTRTLHQVSLKHQAAYSLVGTPHPHPFCPPHSLNPHHTISNGEKLATK